MDTFQFQRLADFAVDAVTPDRNGFTLSGQGADRAEYRLGLRFDMPLDARTRVVLGELFAQSEWSLSRRPPAVLERRRRRRRVTAE